MEQVFRSKVVARRAGAIHYCGMVCASHPELSGKRLSSNGNCLGCNRDKMRVRRADNPEYYRARSRASYEKYKEKYLARSKVRGRLRRTGIDNETYLGLLALQDGKCAICRRVLEGRGLHGDHCHETKKPRGLLCSTCNQAEGLIKRSGLGAEEFGKKLAAYLANPPADSLK